MSLTGFVEWYKEWMNELIGDIWLDNDKEYRCNLRCDIKATPLTENYSIVGTAFDYLMRMYICKLNKMPYKSIANNGRIVAEHSIGNSKKRSRYIESFWDKWQSFNESNNRIFLRIDGLYDFIDDAIVLAKFDTMFRSDYIFDDKELYTSNDDDVQDLKNLLNTLHKPKYLSPYLTYDYSFLGKDIVLNPTFGESSVYIGGADADVIIDGTLIDIKTTKKAEFSKEYLRQLLGYYLLNKRELYPYKINKLGIYFSRYGVLVEVFIPIDNIDVVLSEKPLLMPIENNSWWEEIESGIKEYNDTVLRD
jgi:hypothetical protein